MSFTDAELKELGLPKHIADQWQNVMNMLWNHCNSHYNALNYKNQIVIGKYKIGTYMINNAYLEIKIEDDRHTYLSVLYTNNIRAVINCIDEILK